MNWISIKDRLPNNGQTVILYTDIGNFEIMKFEKDKTTTKIEYNFVIETHCCPIIITLKEVQYWCDLNDIPKPKSITPVRLFCQQECHNNGCINKQNWCGGLIVEKKKEE